MSMTSPRAVRRVSASRELPYGLARTCAVEQVVRELEAEGPEDVLAYALFALVESYVWGGEPTKAYVPFQRSIQLWDSRPELFDESDRHSFFWSFKWMVSGLREHPTIPAAQIEATLADMERRFQVAGNGLDAVAFCAFGWANHRGDDDVEAAFARWVTTARDEYSQCEACAAGDEAEFHAQRGRADRAIELITTCAPTGGWCATEPADMQSVLALLYLDRGEPEAALLAHRRAVAALSTSESDMSRARGRRFELLARGGQGERALAALEQDHRLLVAADSPLSRLQFLEHVLAGLSALAPKEASRAIGLPGIAAVTVGELLTWVEAEASGLAAAFDARNGTTALGDRIWAARGRRMAPAPLDFTVLDVAQLDAAQAPTPAEVADSSARLEVTDASAPSAGASALAIDGSAPPGGSEPAPWRATLAAAELDAEAGRYPEAAAGYLTAAVGAQAEGRLAEAGFAQAEGAHCAQLAGDDDGARAGYLNGCSRLLAGGVAPELVVPVLAAWSPLATTPDRAEALLAVGATVLPRLAEAGALLKQAEPGPVTERLRGSLSLARADLDDLTARVVATVGGSRDWTLNDAAALAKAAAETYAAHHRIGSAAHAFWLYGRLQRELGMADEAIWGLESAVEGFALAREQRPRGEAANELVALLRERGLNERAEEVAASLLD